MGLINKVDMVCLSPVGYDIPNQSRNKNLKLKKSRGRGALNNDNNLLM